MRKKIRAQTSSDILCFNSDGISTIQVLSSSRSPMLSNPIHYLFGSVIRSEVELFNTCEVVSRGLARGITHSMDTHPSARCEICQSTEN